MQFGKKTKKLLRLLSHVEIDAKLIEVIKELYEENKIQFTTGNISTEWLENSVGVRQGCVLSPTLFNIFRKELIVGIKETDKRGEYRRWDIRMCGICR